MAERTDTSSVHSGREQVLLDYLTEKYRFQTKHVQAALLASVMATAGIVLGFLIALLIGVYNDVDWRPHSGMLFTPFVEWEDASTYPLGDVPTEVVVQFTRLKFAATQVGWSMFTRSKAADVVYAHIAGIARVTTLIAVTCAVGVMYRRKLDCYYKLHALNAQRDDWKRMRPIYAWLSRGFFTAATIFGTYVMVSNLWNGLSLIFKDMSLDLPSTALVILIFTFAMTFAATTIALVATTHHVLMLGLVTLVLGFAASFALAPPQGKDLNQWWQLAISSAGNLNPAAPLFTGTLLSVSLALAALWFDIHRIILRLIEVENRTKNVTRRTRVWMGLTIGLYLLLIVGLLFVGLIRVPEDTQQAVPAHLMLNRVFHVGGVFGLVGSALVFAALVSILYTDRWYRAFSLGVLIPMTFVMGVVGSISLSDTATQSQAPPIEWVRLGRGLVSMTVIELTLFSLIGVWMFVTLDMLVAYANIDALKPPTPPPSSSTDEALSTVPVRVTTPP